MCAHSLFECYIEVLEVTEKVSKSEQIRFQTDLTRDYLSHILETLVKTGFMTNEDKNGYYLTDKGKGVLSYSKSLEIYSANNKENKSYNAGLSENSYGLKYSLIMLHLSHL